MNTAVDTHPDAEEVQFRLLRSATVGKRVTMMRSLTRLAVANSRRALRRANPELGPRELDILFVELNYGHELAEGVRQRLMQ